MTTEDMITILTEEAMGQESQFLLDVVARLRELHDANRWRLIEEAPKDWTKVDVWSHWEGRVPDAWWNAKKQRWVSWSPGEYGEMGEHIISPQPTHFRPLPTPPYKEGK